MAILRGRGGIQQTRPTETHNPGSSDGSFMSARTFGILGAGIGVGVPAGVSAGVAAGVTTMKSVGMGWAISLAILAGVVAAITVGLSVVGTLHSLVKK